MVALVVAIAPAKLQLALKQLVIPAQGLHLYGELSGLGFSGQRVKQQHDKHHGGGGAGDEVGVEGQQNHQ